MPQPPHQVVFLASADPVAPVAEEIAGRGVVADLVVGREGGRRGVRTVVPHGELEGAAAARGVAQDAPAAGVVADAVAGPERVRHIAGEERLGLRAARHVDALGVARRRDGGPQHHDHGRLHLALPDQPAGGLRHPQMLAQQEGPARVAAERDDDGEPLAGVLGLEVLRRQIDVRRVHGPGPLADDPYGLDLARQRRIALRQTVHLVQAVRRRGLHQPLRRVTDGPGRAPVAPFADGGRRVVVQPEQLVPGRVELEVGVHRKAERRHDGQLGRRDRAEPPQQRPRPAPGEPRPQPEREPHADHGDRGHGIEQRSAGQSHDSSPDVPRRTPLPRRPRTADSQASESLRKTSLRLV